MPRINCLAQGLAWGKNMLLADVLLQPQGAHAGSKGLENRIGHEHSDLVDHIHALGRREFKETGWQGGVHFYIQKADVGLLAQAIGQCHL